MPEKPKDGNYTKEIIDLRRHINVIQEEADPNRIDEERNAFARLHNLENSLNKNNH